MQDALLLIGVAVFMILGLFAVKMVDKFLGENYKGYEPDDFTEEEKI